MSKDRILRPNQPRTLKIPPTSNRSLIGVAMNRAAAFSRAPIEHSSINSNKKANNFINNILFYSFFWQTQIELKMKMYFHSSGRMND